VEGRRKEEKSAIIIANYHLPPQLMIKDTVKLV